jgi:uncharacterized protein HemY
VLQRLRQLNPYDTGLRRDLGVCYARHGQPGKAVDHLRAYLEAEAEAEDAATVAQILTASQQRLAQWN